MIGRAKFRPHELRGVKPKIYKAAFAERMNCLWGRRQDLIGGKFQPRGLTSAR
jgi:hypothetical protein